MSSSQANLIPSGRAFSTIVLFSLHKLHSLKTSHPLSHLSLIRILIFQSTVEHFCYSDVNYIYSDVFCLAIIFHSSSLESHKKVVQILPNLYYLLRRCSQRQKKQKIPVETHIQPVCYRITFGSSLLRIL